MLQSSETIKQSRPLEVAGPDLGRQQREANVLDEGAVVVDGLGFLEAPRWHNGELWFSDFFSRRVSSVDEAGRLTDRIYVAGQPSGLGFREDGSVLVVSTHEGHILRWDGGAKSVVADIGASYRGGLNDMLVDRVGRAYVSTFPVPAVGQVAAESEAPWTAPLIFVDEDGNVEVAADNLQIPNGIAMTPDGKTLIVAETFGNQLLAFDVAVDGRLGNKRTFADLGDRKPDGICLDANGNVWVGSYSTSEFVLVQEGGRVLKVIATPGRWAVACAIGGSDGRTLYGVTAYVEDFLNDRAKGAVEVFHIDTPAA